MKAIDVQRIGFIRYDQLDDETRFDVRASIQRLTGEDLDDIEVGLQNGPAVLPLVLVDPRVVWKKLPPRRRAASPTAVRVYKEVWLQAEEFPPIVIVSDAKPPHHLQEGFHRTASAIEAKIPLVKAIDLAGIRVVKMENGLETYNFLSSR